MDKEVVDNVSRGLITSSQSQVELANKFDNIIRKIEETKFNFFITGGAGTGKSTLIKKIISKTSKYAVVVAPTGLSARHANGETIQSTFNIRPTYLEYPEISLVKFRRNSKRRDFLDQIELIIIDEVSMLRADTLDAVNDMLCSHASENRNKPFAGKQVVLVGDMLQLPPVIKQKEQKIYRKKYNGKYWFNSKVAQKTQFEIIELSYSFRQSGDKQYLNILNNIRHGKVDLPTIQKLNSRVISNISQISNDTVLLTATNKISSEYNYEKLKQLPENSKTYLGVIEGDFIDEKLPTDLRLELKVNAPIIFVKNCPERKFINGTIGKITQLGDNQVTVLVNNNLLVIKPLKWENFDYSKEEDRLTVTGSFTQLPIKLAWAISIHKSQGLEFDNILLDLGGKAFENGQTYTALSRVKSLSGLHLVRPITEEDIKIDLDLDLLIEKLKNNFLSIKTKEKAQKEIQKEIQKINELKKIKLW